MMECAFCGRESDKKIAVRHVGLDTPGCVVAMCDKCLGVIELQRLTKPRDLFEATYDMVCESFDLTREQMEANLGSRERAFAFPRHLMIYILRLYFNYDYAMIKRIVNKGHATCIYAVNKVHDLLEFDYEFKAKALPVIKFVKENLENEKSQKTITNHLKHLKV